MLNRRSFMALTSAGIATGVASRSIGSAQESYPDIPFRNASFIRDIEPGASATPVATPGATPAQVDHEAEDLHGYILGDPDSPNTLQLYSDFRCPYCREFHYDIEPGLIEDFVAPGRMKLELFDFTVVGVDSVEDLTDDSIETVQASEAVACAAEQGAYLEYRDWLFEGELRTQPGDFSDENLIGAAESLGLDVDLFSESLLSGIYEDSIIAMVMHGIEQGVGGTPTMILNDGEPFFVPEGGYPELQEHLESELL